MTTPAIGFFIVACLALVLTATAIIVAVVTKRNWAALMWTSLGVAATLDFVGIVIVLNA